MSELARGKLRLDRPAPHVARLTIDNPAKRNALDHDILDALAATLPGIEARCLLLTAEGRVFSAADTMLTIPQTASIGIGAALVTVLDYRILLAVMTTVTILCGLYLLTRKSESEVALAVSTPVPAE